MKIDEDDIPDKVRQAAVYAMAPEPGVEAQAGGRRGLDTCEMVRSVTEDMR